MLDKVKYLLRDNRRMAVLDIVLGNLSLIRLLFLLKEIYRERLLQQGVSFVLLICQNGFHRATPPFLLARGRGDSLSRQTSGNAGGRLPVQKHAIDLTNDSCLVLHDLHRSVLALFIPKKVRVGYCHLSIRDSLSPAPCDVFRDRPAFLLRQRRHDGDQQFALAIQRVDILLFRVYSNKTIFHDTQQTTIYSMILDSKSTKY